MGDSGCQHPEEISAGVIPSGARMPAVILASTIRLEAKRDSSLRSE